MPRSQPPTPDADKVAAAIAQLKNAGAEDLAEAVEELAAVRAPGWTTRPPQDPTTTFRADKQLVADVAAQQPNDDSYITTIVVDGCRKFLDGQLQPVRTVRGPAENKITVSVRVPEDLKDQVVEECKRQSALTGRNVWATNVYTAALLAQKSGARRRRTT